MIFSAAGRSSRDRAHGEIQRQSPGVACRPCRCLLASSSALAEHGPGPLDVAQVDQPVGDLAQHVEPDAPAA